MSVRQSVALLDDGDLLALGILTEAEADGGEGGDQDMQSALAAMYRASIAVVRPSVARPSVAQVCSVTQVWSWMWTVRIAGANHPAGSPHLGVCNELVMFDCTDGYTCSVQATLIFVSSHAWCARAA